MKGKGAYLQTGEELSDANISTLLFDGAQVVITKGEKYETHLTKDKGKTDKDKGTEKDSKEKSKEIKEKDKDKADDAKTAATATTTAASTPVPTPAAATATATTAKAATASGVSVGGAAPQVRWLAAKSWLDDDAVKQVLLLVPCIVHRDVACVC